jgi:hypothetical protein
MELFLKPFYSYEQAEDAPADSTKDWQGAVLSFAVHALFLSMAVFCTPLFAPSRNPRSPLPFAMAGRSPAWRFYP